MTLDTESIARFYNIEFTEDVSLVIEPKLKPNYPTRHVADHTVELYRFGRTLGPVRPSMVSSN
jgi:hypothetical protein